MKLKLWLYSSDGGNGSFNVGLVNTKEEALEKLDRTEEEIEDGCFYDDGIIQEIELDIENEKLVKAFYINIE